MKYNELKLGMKDYIEKKITEEDIIEFAKISLDQNPVHLNENYAKNTIFKKRIVHGMLSASFISAVIGNKLPGCGSIYLKQDFKFIAPVYIGDIIRAEVEIIKLNSDKKRVLLKTECFSNKKLVLNGKAEILKID